jgi:peptidyl-dipeptidase A
MRFCALLLLPAAWLAAENPPTVAEAKKFLDRVEASLLDLATEASRASWVQSTYITGDTELLAALANERSINATVRFVKDVKRFDGLKLPPDLARKMQLLKLSLTMATPSNPKESEELTRITAAMEGAYGKGKYCPQPGQCLDLQEIERITRTSRDPKELLDVWKGWRTISIPMRPQYRRFVELSNKGARELGFKDTGAMWRSKYDLAPDEFAGELDRLWEQVRPLYLSLQAYVRMKLREHYGADVVPANGPIPAHLAGNVWAQT